jgi:hypothetical protein
VPRKRRTATKSTYGQGSVYQRKRDQLWVASLTFAPKDRRVVYAHSENEAIAALEDMRRERDNADLVGSQKQPLWEFLDDWIRHTVKQHDLAQSTNAAYSRRLQLVIDQIGDLQVGQVRPAHIRRLLD